MEDWQHGGFGLYLHWPFCQSKCPYCDFNSHVAGNVDKDRWRGAFLAELDRAGAETTGRVLNTVYFGGGTPSLMDPDLVYAILDRVRAIWPMANDPEITLEANPGSIEAGRFRGYRQAGVNRVSMGAQALNDTDLRALGRLHTAAEARAAFDIARNTFDRVSFDLIYARQRQTLAGWKQELTEALAMAVDHLSLYQLTIEEGTAFAARHASGGMRDLPDDDLAAEMYELTQDLCGAAGKPAYEVSNHAAAGAESRHNMMYWRGGDYIGIGPGAHGRLTRNEIRHATEAPRMPDAWLSRVERQGNGELPRERLTPQQHAEEYLMMSLRLAEGTDTARFAGIGGRPLNPDRLAELANLGLVVIEDNRLVATARGRMVLNAVIRELLAG